MTYFLLTCRFRSQ